ncbi:hypothetical protein DCAR_0102291 [Daucus carota subsp. sativus]|uniref:Uncharacterized protein n=1 Tax=Daucus carota subsp. sativus TaxID=79200 RepID=A0A166H071_DAUCS|nr:PREDICTED: uncharacterized protein LOC108209533 [Daucus carota subsp. sativus]WOG83117.1 hypothetical protein DCAR_0102291 [Daucus carota subsp. sativus]
MEGVGARFGRSSTRYGGPATVFTGPVRKWKKKWSPVTNNKHPQNTNGTTSCILLYKWTPYDVNVSDSKKTKAELPRRRFKYIPTAALEEQKNESAEEVDAEDESNSSETKPEAAEPDSKSDGINEKPDMNDVPAKENKDIKDNPQERQDLNESTLDLSLG